MKGYCNCKRGANNDDGNGDCVRKKITHKKAVKLNHILSGVLCAVGFLCILCMVLVDAFQARYSSNRPRNETGESISTVLQSGCKSFNCSISCYNLEYIEDLVEFVELEYQEMNTSLCADQAVSLKISASDFEDGSIDLGHLNTTFKINSLTLNGGDISKDRNILTIPAFSAGSSLKWEGRNISIWNESLLENYTGLIELNVWNCDIRLIEKNALRPVAKTLQIFSLQGLPRKIRLENLTGDMDMTKLQIVDLRYNSFSFELNEDSFTGLRFCRSLYLERSSIVSIPKGTFAPLQDLRILDLKDNELQCLEGNAFPTNPHPELSINIHSNKWNCICSLKWLKHMVEDGKTTGEAVCSAPKEARGKPFNQVDFCSENITPSTEMTPVITTDLAPEITTNTPPNTQIMTTNAQISTTINENIVQLACAIGAFEEGDDITLHTRKLLYDTMDAQIPLQSVYFKIEDDGSGLVKILVSSHLSEHDLLIWFNKRVSLGDLLNISASIGCVGNLTNDITVRNLNPGETYSFCFLNGGERKISPLNCMAHVVVEPWNMRTWLSNGTMPLTISVTGLSLIFCCLLGAFIVYMLIRSNPSLLRGSKRVVMVRRASKTDAIVLPPPKDKVKCLKKYKPNHEKASYMYGKPAFKRSASETSINSGKSTDMASYISATEPTTSQLLNWKFERLRARPIQDHNIRDRFRDFVPPLPPPNLPPPRIPAERPPSPAGTNHYESLTSITEA